MQDFHPDDLTQQQLQHMRAAAEAAWADDTRHPDYMGHPQPSAGQCYVTSRWIQSKLGGHVGLKGGHYFWVSPDKNYVADLTGDQYSYPPADLSRMGLRLDSEDPGWEPTEDHKKWTPGPVLYKPATHPLYKGLRIKSFKTVSPRVQLFMDRADHYLDNPMEKTADLIGLDPYPAQEPQAIEDTNYDRFMHDDPHIEEPGQTEYNFFYGNGQLHVSPHHDHAQLSGHAGISGDHTGPMSAGFVTVDGGRATWHVQGNVALTGFSRVLKDYTKQVGWSWGGLTDIEGQPIDDSFAPKKSMFLRNNEIAEMVPFALQGKTALVGKGFTEEMRAALADAGYRVADYPGGSNMNDLIINHQPSGGEDLETFDHGDPLHPRDPEVNPNETPTGTFRCPECGHILPDWGSYLLHRKTEEPQREFDDDGHFPEMDMDAPLKPHFHEREPTVMPLSSVRQARRVDGFDLYADLWGYNSDEYLHYGAFSNGELLGYATVQEDGDEATVIMVQSAVSGRGIGTALLAGLMRRYKGLKTGAVSMSGERLMTRCGMVHVGGGIWKWAVGQEGKDMIDAPLPFIFDIKADKIYVGYPGTRTSDIPGQFTPGGIVEGEYAPGGKVTMTTETNMPWTAAHMLQLWAYSVPHMQITGLDLMDATGKKTRLAKRTSADVGQYIKQVAATDPAAWMAYQVLKKAGGKVHVVGGAVRDALLQKEPKDIDLMVTGIPAEAVQHALESLPGRMDLTGKNFGVYRYNNRGHEVEVALPRTETSTGDRRVNFDVKVDHNLPVEHDLLRRDFTVNSGAVDLDDGRLIDPYGMAHDVEHRLLRTTHPNSFAEDPTRLLRALVMNARYGFEPDERTRAEIAEHAHRITHESTMAMRPILDKLFSAKNPARAIRLAHDTGLLKHVLPEVDSFWDFDQNNPHHRFKGGDHSLNVLEGVQEQSQDPDLRLAALLHDIGKPGSEWKDPETGFSHYYRGPEGQGADHELVGKDLLEDRLRHLSYPVSRIKRMGHLVGHHMFPAFSSSKGARKFLHRVGLDHANDLLTLRYADQRGKGQTDEELAARTSVDRQRGLVEQVQSAQEPTTMSALSVNGNDIVQLGVKPGPNVGAILRRLTDDVIEDPRLNDRGLLLERATEYVNAIPSV